MDDPVQRPMRDNNPGFPTPEEAALAGYSPVARARVLRVERLNDSFVHVIIDTEPSHTMRVYCERFDGYWYDMGDAAE
jgi:hypothetical protein